MLQFIRQIDSPVKAGWFAAHTGSHRSLTPGKLPLSILTNLSSFLGGGEFPCFESLLFLSGSCLPPGHMRTKALTGRAVAGSTGSGTKSGQPTTAQCRPCSHVPRGCRLSEPRWNLASFFLTHDQAALLFLSLSSPYRPPEHMNPLRGWPFSRKTAIESRG